MANLHMTVHGDDGPELFAVGKTVHGTAGNDTRHGTANDDTFKFGQGGTDTLDGRSGDDVFLMGANLDPTDRIEGGKGFDTVVLDGDYTAPQNFSAVFSGIEKIVLSRGFSYLLSLSDLVQPNSTTLTIDASHLTRGQSANMFGGDTGHFDMTGGAGNDDVFGGSRADLLRGGAGNDYICGLGGADQLYSENGSDTFDLSAPFASTSAAHDTIFAFDPRFDHIAVNKAVQGVDDAINDFGSLSADTFDADMREWVNADTLHREHAVLFRPEHGDLGGHTFLIIDNNGRAGYQANHDYVVELNGAEHLNMLSAETFLTSG